MTEDPHKQDEQPAGATSPERAELLGTTALTARVRCFCGKRQDVDREDWQWDGVTVCSRCGRGILDHSLHVVSRTQALAMIEERRPTESELRTLRRMELALRDFVLLHGGHPRWHWSPPTNAMAEEVGSLLTDLDESRRDRGAPPVVATGRAFLDEDAEGASVEADVGHAGEEVYEDNDDEDELVAEEGE